MTATRCLFLFGYLSSVNSAIVVGVVVCAHRSASRVKHAGAFVPTSRSGGSHRLPRGVQPTSHGSGLVEGRPNARLPDGAARQGQQIRHAHSTACDIVRRGTVFVYAVLAARRRTHVRSRPHLRPRSAPIHTAAITFHKFDLLMGQGICWRHGALQGGPTQNFG